VEQVGSQGCEEMDEMIDALTKALPLIAAILYMIVAVGYGVKKEWAWCLVWSSYALANVGLVLASMTGELK
tara:strand:+ start:636 stop:848 length:213 start_codon:yes stop_codon:yes gene_type:complete